MFETIFITDKDQHYTICVKNKEVTVSADDCMRNYNFLNLVTGRYYSPIELLAEVADLINALDGADFKAEDVKSPEDVSEIFEDAPAFMTTIDIIVANKCPCRIYANTYKKLSFMLHEHIVNTSILSYLKPDWWRNWEIEHEEFYQNFMDAFLNQLHLH